MGEQFDHIVSLGMFEHVGVKNYRTYFEIANRCLKEEGLFLLHTIGGHKSKRHVEPWINKYIFRRRSAFLGAGCQRVTRTFIMEDWHNFGYDYYKTLMAWFENFDHAWPELKKSGKYDERFYRMWKYYLLSTAGAFKARRLQLWQLVLSPKGIPGGHKSVR